MSVADIYSPPNLQDRTIVTEMHEKALSKVGALEKINRVVAAALDTWDLPARVKRLALPSYRYTKLDARHLIFIGAWREEKLIGIAALEPAGLRNQTSGQDVMLLHGLFVDPTMHGQGVGTRLVAAAKRASWTREYSQLRVRAERQATGFLLKQGFDLLTVANEETDYPYQLSAPLITDKKQVA